MCGIFRLLFVRCIDTRGGLCYALFNDAASNRDKAVGCGKVHITKRRYKNAAVKSGVAGWGIAMNHRNGKLRHAYGTSMTSVQQGKYVPVVEKLSGLTVVNHGIPGGSLTSHSYGRVKGGKYQVDNIHLNDLGGVNMGQFVWSRLKNIPLWQAE